MKNKRIILEAVDYSKDEKFLTALVEIKNLDVYNPDYYIKLNEYLGTINDNIGYLSTDTIKKIKEGQNAEKIKDIFINTYKNASSSIAQNSQDRADAYANTIKPALDSAYGSFANDFLITSTQQPVASTATAPAVGGGPAPARAATPAVAAQAASGGGTPAATAQGVNKTALFQKYMGSYDPNSSMDKAKMGLVDQALETFKKENKTDFTGSSEDITKMNKIMNDVYQSKEYAGIVKGKGAATTDASKTTGQPTVKFGKQDMPTFIQVANGKFIPATEKDVQAGNQIWMKNPRKGQGEDQKPNYVQVRTEKGNSLRPKSQLPGALGSVSNLLGDIGRTLDKTSRTPRTKPKK